MGVDRWNILMSNATTARAPVIPLVVHDPFMSAWSWSDTATDTWPAHWTGKQNQMSGMLHVDGTAWRFMGRDSHMAAAVPAMTQVGREVTPLRTIYRFAAGGVELQLTFTSPMLPDDLELVGRPVSYIDIAVRSTDGGEHATSVYYDFSANWTVGDAETELSWGRHRAGQVEALFMGAAEQRPLKRSGDEVQIEWGYLFVSSVPGLPVSSSFGEHNTLRDDLPGPAGLPIVTACGPAGRCACRQAAPTRRLPFASIWVRWAVRARPGASWLPMTRSGP